MTARIYKQRATVAMAAVLCACVTGCAGPRVMWPPIMLSSEDSGADRGDRRAITRAMERVYPALVRIRVVTVDAHGGRLKKYQAAGSGVIISKDGHVITNHHVAGKARRMICRMPDGEEIEATLVGADPLADIAVLKLKLDQRKNTNKPLPVAVFGDSDRVRVGDTVLAMGSPVALSQSVTKGIVSNTAMILPRFFWPFTFKLDGEDIGTLVRWIAHDAAIYGGNSGGPLVNLDGEIIGINEISLGLGGAIPGNLARSVAEQLMKTGEVKRSWTGLECQPLLKDSKHVRGALIGGVIKHSPADKAGLKPGDILLSYDGVDVTCRIAEDLPVFNQLTLSTPIDKTVKIHVLRDGVKKTFSLTTVAGERSRGEDKELKAWGMSARNFTRMSALERKRKDKKGVFVHTLRPGGPCLEAKPPLQHGDVITHVDGKPVPDIAALRSLSRERTQGEEDRTPVLVTFERKSEELLTVVTIGKELPEEEPMTSRKAWFPAVTQALTESLAQALGLKGEKGVRVIEIFPGHSAEKAGLKVGDVILKVDGETIEASQPEDVEVFSAMIRQYKIGAKPTFDLFRDGKRRKLTVQLEAPPTPPSELKRYKDDNFELTVRELAFEDRVAQELEPDVRGVVVERVEPAGWAKLAQVALNDILLSIDNTPTPNIDAVERLLKEAEARKAKRLVLFVKRGIHTMYLELEPNWSEE